MVAGQHRDRKALTEETNNSYRDGQHSRIDFFMNAQHQSQCVSQNVPCRTNFNKKALEPPDPGLRDAMHYTAISFGCRRVYRGPPPARDRDRAGKQAATVHLILHPPRPDFVPRKLRDRFPSRHRDRRRNAVLDCVVDCHTKCEPTSCNYPFRSSGGIRQLNTPARCHHRLAITFPTTSASQICLIQHLANHAHYQAHRAQEGVDPEHRKPPAYRRFRVYARTSRKASANPR